MAEEVRTRQGIVERNRAAAARMDAALSRLSDEQVLAPNAVGDWSLRDTLSHLGNQWLPEQLESYLENRPPDALAATGTTEPPGPEFDVTTTDGRNAWRHHVRLGESLEEVRARYRTFLARMDSVIERMPEEEFERPFSIAFSDYVGLVRPAADGEQGFPLWRWIQGEYWHHLEDHASAFEAAVL
jgi:hypothetical protein